MTCEDYSCLTDIARSEATPWQELNRTSCIRFAVTAVDEWRMLSCHYWNSEWAKVSVDVAEIYYL